METDSEKQKDKDDEDRPAPPAEDDEPAKADAPETGDDAPADDEPKDDAPKADAEASAVPAPKRKKKKKKGASSGPPAEPAAEPAKKPPPSTGMLLIGGLVVAALVGGGVYLIRRQSGSHNNKWNVGDEADVEITIVPADAKNLACASADEVAGRHCGFEAQSKPWSKSTDTDDKKILKPYTTTDRVQLAAAGLWSEPALSGSKLPTGRFSVKCKYKVEGNLKKPSIRWAAAGPWSDSPRDWYSGVVTGCTVVP